MTARSILSLDSVQRIHAPILRRKKRRRSFLSLAPDLPFSSHLFPSLILCALDASLSDDIYLHVIHSQGAPSTEAIYPAPSGTAKPPATLADEIKANITAIINGNDTDCNKCLAALPVAQKLARANPQAGPQVMIDLCKQYKYKSPNTTCQRTYAPAILGSQYTQVLSYADFTSPNSTDAQYICSINLGKCPLPAPRELDSAFLHSWFRGKTQKPKVPTKKHPGKPKFGKHGKRENLRVLHFSDIHVDPRFLIGSEAACTNGQCCRADSYNGTLTSSPPGSNASALVSPAVYWGNFHCDAPWPLTMAALESIEVMAGEQGLDMSLYTGDMVTHDAAWHLSHDLVTYTQQSMFDLFKAYLGNGPVFAAIGNVGCPFFSFFFFFLFLLSLRAHQLTLSPLLSIAARLCSVRRRLATQSSGRAGQPIQLGLGQRRPSLASGRLVHRCRSRASPFPPRRLQRQPAQRSAHHHHQHRFLVQVQYFQHDQHYQPRR